MNKLCKFMNNLSCLESKDYTSATPDYNIYSKYNVIHNVLLNINDILVNHITVPHQL